MTNRLPTDTYYRGYRLSMTSEGGTHVWYGCDLVDTFDSTAIAHAQIDKWIDEAR